MLFAPSRTLESCSSPSPFQLYRVLPEVNLWRNSSRKMRVRHTGEPKCVQVLEAGWWTSTGGTWSSFSYKKAGSVFPQCVENEWHSGTWGKTVNLFSCALCQNKSAFCRLGGHWKCDYTYCGLQEVSWAWLRKKAESSWDSGMLK